MPTIIEKEGTVPVDRGHHESNAEVAARSLPRITAEVPTRLVGPDPCVPDIGKELTTLLGPSPDPWLARIDRLTPKDKYWYLAGPMSGRAGFNFPEFDRVAARLRAQAYPIVSPAEFEHEDVRHRLLEAKGTEPHDEVGPAWADCLARDVVIVAHPNCVGIILLDEWQDSPGARFETEVAERLGKPLFEFYERPMRLIQIERSRRLQDWDDIVDARQAINEVKPLKPSLQPSRWEPLPPPLGLDPFSPR